VGRLAVVVALQRRHGHSVSGYRVSSVLNEATSFAVTFTIPSERVWSAPIAKEFERWVRHNAANGTPVLLEPPSIQRDGALVLRWSVPARGAWEAVCLAASAMSAISIELYGDAISMTIEAEVRDSA
jgi:hypothetical protein